MKKKLIKRFVSGLLAAAIVFTTAPIINFGTTVTAEAGNKTKVELDGPFNKDSPIYVGKSSVFGLNLLFFAGMKSKAKYTITTNSKNLSIKMHWKDYLEMCKEQSPHFDDLVAEYSYNLLYTINAKKAGIYKVTIKENYKGTTRTLVKNAKFYVSEPKLAKSSITMKPHASIYMDSLLKNYYLGSYKYNVTKGKNTVVKVKKDDSDNKCIVAKSAGKAEIVFSDYYGKKCGTLTITVKK